MRYGVAIILVCTAVIIASLLDVRCSIDLNTSGRASALLRCGGNAEGCAVAANRGAQPSATLVCDATWRWGRVQP